MYAQTLEKLTGLLAAWDPPYQCALFFVLIGVATAIAYKVIDAATETSKMVLALLRSVVTVPVAVFHGWENSQVVVPPVHVTCRCDCDDEDDEDDDPDE
jgi:hypothetical protein